MRALFQRDLQLRETYVVDGKALHHLVNVIRIDEGEELLLLRGDGLRVLTKVERISKKALQLSFLEDRSATRAYHFDLALGAPKREALELCLKQATELGFRKLYLIRSDFSQQRIPEEERLENLLVSALEQSNGAFLPELHSVSWESLPWEEYASVVLLDSQTGRSDSLEKLERTAPALLVVGPEGGFSQREIELLHATPAAKIVKLPTPILRSPTAVAVGAGLMLQSLLD